MSCLIWCNPHHECLWILFLWLTLQNMSIASTLLYSMNMKSSCRDTSTKCTTLSQLNYTFKHISNLMQCISALLQKSSLWMSQNQRSVICSVLPNSSSHWKCTLPLKGTNATWAVPWKGIRRLMWRGCATISVWIPTQTTISPTPVESALCSYWGLEVKTPGSTKLLQRILWAGPRAPLNSRSEVSRWWFYCGLHKLYLVHSGLIQTNTCIFSFQSKRWHWTTSSPSVIQASINSHLVQMCFCWWYLPIRSLTILTTYSRNASIYY